MTASGHGGAARRPLHAVARLVARRRRLRVTAVRLTAPGAAPRTLPPGDPAAQALLAAAEALLSAAQRGSRG